MRCLCLMAVFFVMAKVGIGASEKFGTWRSVHFLDRMALSPLLFFLLAEGMLPTDLLLTGVFKASNVALGDRNE